MQRSMRIQRMLSCLGATLLLSPALVPISAQADPILMSGNVQLTTNPSVRRNYSDYGMVEVNGSAPATISVHEAFMQNDGTAFRVFPAVPNVAQVTSSFTSFNLAETLMAGGGPGSFTFCPGVGNPLNQLSPPNNCQTPNQATGGLNNRIVYTAGPNQYGGTFRILQELFKSSVSLRIATNPSQFSHQVGDTVPRIWPGGAPMSSTQFITRPGGQITSAPVLGPSGSIQTPGAVVGTGEAPDPSINTGFPVTTGMVVHSDTNPSPFMFTLTGSDSRTAMGAGQIVLVGSGVARAATGTDFGREIQVTLVPEPHTTAMFVAGMLVLLGLYSQRRRLFSR